MSTVQLPEKEISPASCEHRDCWNVRSGRHTGLESSGDHSVRLCKDCGSFIVFARENGQCVEIKFTLPLLEMVESAGIWARFLDECVKRGE